MLPVTIYTAMMNDCQQDAKAPSLENRVIPCILALLWNLIIMDLTGGGGGGGGGEQ